MMGQEEVLLESSALSRYWEGQSGIPYIEIPSADRVPMVEATTNTAVITSADLSSTVVP